MRVDSGRLHSTKRGAALHVFGRHTDFKSDRLPHAFEQEALAVTLDGLVLEIGPLPPTRIQIDVDGLEADVLRGALQMLSGPRLRGLLLEINERQEADLSLVEHLGSLEIRVIHKGAPVIDATGGAKTVNDVFARD